MSRLMDKRPQCTSAVTHAALTYHAENRHTQVLLVSVKLMLSLLAEVC